MHSEIRAVKDEKSYWEERLSRMSRQIDSMGRIKNKCAPMTKKRFNLFNKNNRASKSKLLESGALHISRTFNEMQRTRTIMEKGEEVEKSTSRKQMGSEEGEEEEEGVPLGQGIVNDNLHPFSEIKGRSYTIYQC
jgi:hypothetical protein